MTNLFQLGDVTLNSGKQSKFKIECDALTGADWHALAVAFAAGYGGAWGAVEGVPRGGLVLAGYLNEYSKTREEAYAQGIFSYVDVLVVDDVATTGNSIRGLAKAFRRQGKTVDMVVAFSRMLPSEMYGPERINSMFQMAGWMNLWHGAD